MQERESPFAYDFGTHSFQVLIHISSVCLHSAADQGYVWTMTFFDQLKFDAGGLIPAIIQEQSSGRVLMMAWMNRASLEKTLATGKTHFWSRSRQRFWMKGESSGHTQSVKDIAFDCDGDALLIQVEQIGAACHEGYKSCFFRSVEDQGGEFRVSEPRLVAPGKI